MGNLPWQKLVLVEHPCYLLKLIFTAQKLAKWKLISGRLFSRGNYYVVSWRRGCEEVLIVITYWAEAHMMVTFSYWQGLSYTTTTNLIHQNCSVQLKGNPYIDLTTKYPHTMYLASISRMFIHEIYYCFNKDFTNVLCRRKAQPRNRDSSTG